MAIQKITTAAIGISDETSQVTMPKGTTAQRATATAGDIRFNTTLSLMEYYDGTNWKAIDAPPVLASVSGYINENDTTTLTLTGSNIQSGATVSYYNYSTGALIKSAPVTTVVSSTSATATTGNNSVAMTAGVAVSIRLTNPSGLYATLDNALTVEADPTWVTSSGSLATIYDSQRSSYSSISVSATSSTGIVTYAVQSGSLPTGLSLNTSTGAITGTASAVGSSTTSSFTLRATTDAQATSFTDRNFSITVREPIVTSYTTVGSGSFSVPSGISAVWAVVVAGGGSGGNGDGEGGAGGAGGMIEWPAVPVTPGGTVSYTVGAGATQIDGNPGNKAAGNTGSDSVFGSLTAKGGGAGGSYNNIPGGSGGSGGGGGGNGGPGGPGTQPAQPGNSATYGFGNPGGAGSGGGRTSGGGGGAGGAGAGSPNTTGGAGGVGRSTSISSSPVFYAGGGGGAANNASGTAGPGGTGGGGPGGQVSTKAGTPGTTNTGGGGGGGHDISIYRTGGNGGPGIVIVRY